MGGYGSGKGTRRRRGKKGWVDSYPKVSVNQLVKSQEKDLRQPPYLEGISFRLCGDDIYLLTGSGWRYAYKLFKVSKDTVYLGGHRYYAHCNACDRRMGKAIFAGDGCYCRQCLNLSYYSQSKPLHVNMILKGSSIEKKLGSIYTKPKHMHNTTFDRYMKEYEKAHEVCDVAEIFSIRTVEIAAKVLDRYGDACMAGDCYMYKNMDAICSGGSNMYYQNMFVRECLKGERF